MVTGPQRAFERSQSELEKLGVPANDVIYQPTGTDTLGSLAVVATLLKDLGWTSATIVTDPAHSARAQVTAGKYGIDAHMAPSSGEGSSTLTSEYVAREAIALVRYYLYNQWQVPRDPQRTVKSHSWRFQRVTTSTTSRDPLPNRSKKYSQCICP